MPTRRHVLGLLPALGATALAAACTSDGCIVAVGIDSGVQTLAHARSGLRTIEAGSGKVPFVIMHGYGASAREWVPFASTIRMLPDTRFVFPEAPERTYPPDGPVGGRGWWRLDLASYRRGGGLPDMSRAQPEGLPRSAAAIRTLVRELQDRQPFSSDRLILGGYSQGAMIAAEIAFRSNEPLRALILLSGTFVDEARWTAGMAARRGLPVFIAHGRQDDVLPFESSERLAQAMQRAGLQVTWFPFDGVHETPAAVVDALNRFLGGLEP